MIFLYLLFHRFTNVLYAYEKYNALFYQAKKHKTPFYWSRDVSSKHIYTYSLCFSYGILTLTMMGKNLRVFPSEIAQNKSNS